MMTPVLRRLLIKAGLVNVLFLAVFFLGILPKFMAVRRLSAEVHRSFHDNQILQEMILTAKNSGQRLERIQEKLEQYRKKVLRPGDLTHVLDEIGSQAQAEHMNVLSLQALDQPRKIPGEPFTDGEWEIQQVRIALKAEGEYPDLQRYFKQLEGMPYQVSVQSIFLKNTSVDAMVPNKEPLLRMEVTLGVLMRFPKSKIPEPGGPL